MEAQLGLEVPGGVGSVRLDWSLVLFTAATALFSGLLMGLRPAFGALVAGTSRLGTSVTRGEVAGHGRFRASMVVSQVALSFLLIAGAGLMVQTLLALQRSDLGFNPEGVLKGHVLLPQARYADRPARAAAVRTMIEQVHTLPGVDAAATVMPHPFRFQGSQPLVAEGVNSQDLRAVHHVVAGNYWRTMGIRLVDGRAFDDRDRAGSPMVTMISQSLSRRLWPDGSALGRRIRTSTAPDAPSLTIVGVVEDVRKTFVETLVGDTYVPHAQSPGAYLALMVRGTGDPALLAQPVQRRAEGRARAGAEVERSRNGCTGLVPFRPARRCNAGRASHEAQARARPDPGRSRGRRALA